jgi:hypothetical protein
LGSDCVGDVRHGAPVIVITSPFQCFSVSGFGVGDGFEPATVVSTGTSCRVMNRAETKSYYLGITRPVSRPRGGTELLVTVGEAPARQARPIQAWFPLGQIQGHAFIYER